MDEQERKWHRKGVGFAWTMLVGAVIYLFLFVWPGAWSGDGSQMAPATATMSNMKQLAIALQTYAGDNDGRLPANFSTNEDVRAALASYDLYDGIFETRNVDGGEIVPNQQLAGVKLSEVFEPDKTVLLYESKTFWWHGMSMHAFADASVHWASADSLLKFEPGEPDPFSIP